MICWQPHFITKYHNFRLIFHQSFLIKGMLANHTYQKYCSMDPLVIGSKTDESNDDSSVCHQDGGHMLYKDDIGKKVIKVAQIYRFQSSWDIYGEKWIPDKSYMRCQFIVENIEFGLHQCEVCKKGCKLICAGCMDIPYCSKECQKKDRNSHKNVCRRNEYIPQRKLPITKIILVKDDGEKKVLDTKLNPTDKYYFYGWERVEDVKK